MRENLGVHRNEGHAVLEVELLIEPHLTRLLVFVGEEHHGLINSIVGRHISNHCRHTSPAHPYSRLHPQFHSAGPREHLWMECRGERSHRTVATLHLHGKCNKYSKVSGSTAASIWSTVLLQTKPTLVHTKHLDARQAHPRVQHAACYLDVCNLPPHTLLTCEASHLIVSLTSVLPGLIMPFMPSQTWKRTASTASSVTSAGCRSVEHTHCKLRSHHAIHSMQLFPCAACICQLPVACKRHGTA